MCRDMGKTSRLAAPCRDQGHERGRDRVWSRLRVLNGGVKRWPVLAALAGLVLGGLLSATEPVRAQAVTDIRLGLHGDQVRVVVETDRKLDLSSFILDQPYRIVVDLPEVRWQLDAEKGRQAVGFVSGFRFGHFAPGRSRVVFDMERPAVISRNFTLEPGDGRGWRYVLDLGPVSEEAFAGALRRPGSPGSAPAAADSQAAARGGGTQAAVLVPPPPPSRRPADARRVIVIDPGHGGIDPGTIGRAQGTLEKDVTLATALELRRILEQRGRYRVVMTRDRDVFVRLRDRVSMARAASGDLFLSLHADAIADPRLRGASVYTLSETASDREAAALASRENRADLIAGIDLTQETDEVSTILIDLARRDTMNQSAIFAHGLIEEMGKVTSFIRRSHRFAGFVVLQAPDVPSVLVEMGYLSNAQDEARLSQPRYRARLAAAMADAIDRYFDARDASEAR